MFPGRQRFGDLVAIAHDRLVRSASIGPDSKRARGFARFGPGSIICFPPAALFGETGIRIGSGVTIGPNVSLSAGMAPDQDLLSDEVVTIGDRCLIGRNSSIVGHFRIEIGPDVYFGPNVYVTDQNHSRDDPGLPIGRQSAAEQPVTIGQGSWIGTNAVILPGVTIGSRVIVGAGSIVTSNVPDGALAVGVPARIVESVAVLGDQQAI